MPFISKTPKPPYYPSFSRLSTPTWTIPSIGKHISGWWSLLEGYLGIEPARNPDGSGATNKANLIEMLTYCRARA
jgi:hypothetical protein